MIYHIFIDFSPVSPFQMEFRLKNEFVWKLRAVDRQYDQYLSLGLSILRRRQVQTCVSSFCSLSKGWHCICSACLFINVPGLNKFSQTNMNVKPFVLWIILADKRQCRQILAGNKGILKGEIERIKTGDLSTGQEAPLATIFSYINSSEK